MKFFLSSPSIRHPQGSNGAYVEFSGVNQQDIENFSKFRYIVHEIMARVERWDFIAARVLFLKCDGELVTRCWPKPEDQENFTNRTSNSLPYEEIGYCPICKECGRIRWEKSYPDHSYHSLQELCDLCKTEELLGS